MSPFATTLSVRLHLTRVAHWAISTYESWLHTAMLGEPAAVVADMVTAAELATETLGEVADRDGSAQPRVGCIGATVGRALVRHACSSALESVLTWLVESTAAVLHSLGG